MKFLLNCFLFMAVSATVQGQLENIWKDYGELCGKTGIPWYLTFGPCKDYNGTVQCVGTGLRAKCDCNLGEYAYFDTEEQVCVGMVGAVCTAEKTSLVPGKRCTKNADCFARSNYTVGTCECLYGYKKTDGRCVVDDTIGDDQRSTRRPTTTTTAADRGDFKLPPGEVILDLLLGESVGLGETCTGGFIPLLNRTSCKLHQMTVSCVNNACGCNMGDVDAIFDASIDQCVGLVGSYCLTRKNILGWKACVEGSDCFLDEGEDYENHSFGTCQCLYGWNEQPDGTCVRDPSITNPSTRRPGGPAVSSEPTTRAPSTSTEGGAAQKTASLIGSFMMLSVIYFLI